MSNQSMRTGAKKQVFNASSPGFIYTLVVAFLTIFAAAGVQFPDKAGELANDIATTLSASGFYAIIGVIVASVAFPIWNAIQKKTLSFAGVFNSTLTWIALGNALFAAIALTGFTLPDGTIEQLVMAISVKDWGAIISMLVTTIIPAIVRFIKDKNAPVVGA